MQASELFISQSFSDFISADAVLQSREQEQDEVVDMEKKERNVISIFWLDLELQHSFTFLFLKRNRETETE